MTEFGTAGLGRTLRAERLCQGIDLAAIAAETKISCSILDAIEGDRFDRLPGGAYRRSFVRQYARSLGLDEAGAVAAFRQQFTEPCLPLPVPLKQTRPSRFLQVGRLLAAAAALVAIYKTGESGQTFLDSREAGVAQFRPAAAAQLQTPVPVVAAPSEPDLLRVALTATESVWVSVKCNGVLKYTGTLLGQEIKTFEASRVVTVLIGNAGGLVISLDGKPIGPVGPRGATQLVELTAGGAHRLPLHPRPAKTTDHEPEG